MFFSKLYSYSLYQLLICSLKCSSLSILWLSKYLARFVQFKDFQACHYLNKAKKYQFILYNLILFLLFNNFDFINKECILL